MRTDTGQFFRLDDYRPTDYLIPRTELVFNLAPEHTLVTATLTVEPREARGEPVPLVLDGDGLKLVSLAVDGKRLGEGDYTATPDRLEVTAIPPADRFTLEIVTEVNPTANRQLSGLYRSNSVYCTQCEAEGFRRITYFLDRPDVLSVYRVRIEAGRTEAPVLLSNGNPVEAGELGDGRHYAIWDDPHPKPSYLFALVAGDLGHIADDFTTASGRPVKLGIYVEHGKEGRAGYAMDALKRSMRWDEEKFGREYDLDVFNIVAVSDFNMGAMENKGLNIFNDKYVLADPETATDTDYANIEAVIAHEYFHNWTGNRITCRDWFQLCLKEGLTVFRDHEFSSDQRSRAVKRIMEVKTLMAHQFPEDAGPLAHPVRPRRYREINNFYTATVYEKGSEVVRMIRTLLGADKFREGMDLYFERHDGEAATVEEFVKVFEDVSGEDLTQFALWYHQAGTPNISVSYDYDAEAKTFRVDIEQSVKPTPGEARKKPMHIPIKFGLLGPNGHDIVPASVEGGMVTGDVIQLKKRKESFTFTGIGERPVPSLLREFSAPVTVTTELDERDLMFIALNDSDPVARWQMLTRLLTKALIAGANAIRNGDQAVFGREVTRLVADIATNEQLDHAFRALCLTLPSESEIARDMGENIDPDAILKSREALIGEIGDEHGEAFARLFDELASDAPFSPDAASAGRRALRNVILDYLSAAEGKPERAKAHFDNADNMTDRAAALQVLAHRFNDTRDAKAALDAFEKRYGSDPLVMDKWFAIQATRPGADALDDVRRLLKHKGFALDNPNRARALIGAFATANQTGFNRADGEGYRFFGTTVIEIEKTNPQLAARLLTAMRSWRSLEPQRREEARKVLADIAAIKELSADMRDIVDRTLA